MSHQKGVSLYLTVVILSIVLAIALGLGAIFWGQLRTIRNIGDSVVALYAADTGIERALREVFKETSPHLSSFSELNIGNGSGYEAEAVCCSASTVGCEFDGTTSICDLIGSPIDDNCQATKYCVRSVGDFNGTKRALEVKIYPVIQP